MFGRLAFPLVELATELASLDIAYDNINAAAIMQPFSLELTSHQIRTRARIQELLDGFMWSARHRLGRLPLLRSSGGVRRWIGVWLWICLGRPVRNTRIVALYSSKMNANTFPELWSVLFPLVTSPTGVDANEGYGKRG